jgi:hypothetical protein
MILSSGIMSSQGDRRDVILAQHTPSRPITQENFNVLGDQINYQNTRRLTQAPNRHVKKTTLTFIRHNNFLSQQNQYVHNK